MHINSCKKSQKYKKKIFQIEKISMQNKVENTVSKKKQAKKAEMEKKDATKKMKKSRGCMWYPRKLTCLYLIIEPTFLKLRFGNTCGRDR